VLGIVVTETLYRTHPDLSEGRLAKLRAAVVNARALAEVARTIGSASTSSSAAARRAPAAATRPRSSPTPSRRDRRGLPRPVASRSPAGGPPAVRPADGGRRRLGAGLDWKTSLQELSAERGLGVPEYVIEDEGPDHMKTFTAQVRVGDQLYGHGEGRSKKEAEQQAAETAYREIAARLGDPSSRSPTPSRRRLSPPERPRVPELPEVEVVRRGLERTSSAGRSSASRCSTRGPYAAPGRRVRLRRAADRPHVHRGPPPRQVPLAPARQPATRLLGHLGMSGQMLVQPVRRTRETPARALRLRRRRGASCASSTSGCSAACRVARGSRAAPEIAHIARDPLDPEFDDDGVRRRVARKHVRVKRLLLDQTLVSGVGNIYADEALWRAGCTASGRGTGSPRPRCASCRRTPAT
jgi:ribonuclease-3